MRPELYQAIVTSLLDQMVACPDAQFAALLFVCHRSEILQGVSPQHLLSQIPWN